MYIYHLKRITRNKEAARCTLAYGKNQNQQGSDSSFPEIERKDISTTLLSYSYTFPNDNSDGQSFQYSFDIFSKN